MTTLKQNPFVFGHLMDDLFPTTNAYYPPVNIHENEKGFSIELKVPGIKKEEVSIQMEKGLLTISFQSKENKEPKAEKNFRFSRVDGSRILIYKSKSQQDRERTEYVNRE